MDYKPKDSYILCLVINAMEVKNLSTHFVYRLCNRLSVVVDISNGHVDFLNKWLENMFIENNYVNT